MQEPKTSSVYYKLILKLLFPWKKRKNKEHFYDSLDMKVAYMKVA